MREIEEGNQGGKSMREIDEWWRPHSVEAVAASSQEGDGALTRLDQLDMTTAPPIGTNLTIVSHAFARIMATGDDRPRSVNRSYPQGSHTHSSQVINPLPLSIAMALSILSCIGRDICNG
jgi:hypothetical protein